MKTLSIIIPVYCNAPSLKRLFKELEALESRLRHKNIAVEYICVDDGSTDDSLVVLAELKEIHKNIKIIKLSRNFGAVFCSKTGMRYVTGDAFVVVAADLQDPPSLIDSMVDLWVKGNKFVICERNTRDDPILSKFFSAIYYFLVRALVLPNFPKGGFDMALMDSTLLPYFVNSSKSIFPSILGYWLGFSPAVINYHRPMRAVGRSKWTLGKKINAFLDVMLGFSIKPIRLISCIGVFVSALSFLYGLMVVLGAIFHGVEVPGFSTIVAILTFLLGLIILMLGLIAEYLWRIYDEVNKRPETVIDEIW